MGSKDSQSNSIIHGQSKVHSVLFNTFLVTKSWSTFRKLRTLTCSNTRTRCENENSIGQILNFLLYWFRRVKILKFGIIENIAILHLINANLVPSSYESKIIIINYTNNIKSKSAMMENLTFGIEKVWYKSSHWIVLNGTWNQMQKRNKQKQNTAILKISVTTMPAGKKGILLKVNALLQ